MAWIFDHLVFLVRSLMLGDQFFFVIEKDRLVIGLEGKHARGIGKGDTVAIGFKLGQRLGSAFHTPDQAGIKINLGQRDQKGFLLLFKEVNWSCPGGAMDSAIGHLVSPGTGLEVEVGQGEEGSSREEIGFDIADRFFDPSLLMGGFHIAGGRVEEVVSGEGEETGIELDGRTDAVKDHAG